MPPVELPTLTGGIPGATIGSNFGRNQAIRPGSVRGPITPGTPVRASRARPPPQPPAPPPPPPAPPAAPSRPLVVPAAPPIPFTPGVRPGALAPQPQPGARLLPDGATLVGNKPECPGLWRYDAARGAKRLYPSVDVWRAFNAPLPQAVSCEVLGLLSIGDPLQAFMPPPPAPLVVSNELPSGARLVPRGDGTFQVVTGQLPPAGVGGLPAGVGGLPAGVGGLPAGAAGLPAGGGGLPAAPAVLPALAGVPAAGPGAAAVLPGGALPAGAVPYAAAPYGGAQPLYGLR
ncbi:hypothetical protein Rsub_03199 [Raphidocelis subcapitata]|uniref:Uncharacterized protein n=1 Tax=Raphidocelis subcapitata TaxID=307507 RepID=A0A2V0P0B5_9CHLO|nr:hypothetical protein Rsub_03199 [Raphidocelis subcapitata]|eukprot:GBF90627.1 hypothetical protein Rsub_03199 [Raphidocelis subcapitata]